MSPAPVKFSLAAIVAQKLYYGPFRRVFRWLVSRIAGDPAQRRILLGPLRGARWFANEMSCALGVYEMGVQDQILQHVKVGGVFYDIGANRGFFSLLAARLVGEQGRVFAFEPFPANVAQLKRLFAENQLNTVTLVPKAVAQQTGTTEIFAQDTGTQADGVMATLLERPGDKPIAIETLTLDEFIAQHPAPHFVKMDIEGAEVLALKGAQKLLAQPAPITWLIECHSAQLESEVAELLQAHGYATRIIAPKFVSQRAADRHLLAWKN